MNAPRGKMPKSLGPCPFTKDFCNHACQLWNKNLGDCIFNAINYNPYLISKKLEAGR